MSRSLERQEVYSLLTIEALLHGRLTGRLFCLFVLIGARSLRGAKRSFNFFYWVLLLHLFSYKESFFELFDCLDCAGDLRVDVALRRSWSLGGLLQGFGQSDSFLDLLSDDLEQSVEERDHACLFVEATRHKNVVQCFHQNADI